MVLKNVCLIPHAWTLVRGVKPIDIYRMHSCSDGSHSHISESRLRKYESRSLAWVLRRPSAENPRIIAVRIPDYDAAASLSLHGRSCQLGEYLTLALVAKLLWARVMLADIRRSAVEEDHDS